MFYILNTKKTTHTEVFSPSDTDCFYDTKPWGVVGDTSVHVSQDSLMIPYFFHKLKDLGGSCCCCGGSGSSSISPCTSFCVSHESVWSCRAWPRCLPFGHTLLYEFTYSFTLSPVCSRGERQIRPLCFTPGCRRSQYTM